MGLLDGMLGGIVGAGLVTVVKNVIDQNGGVGALVDRFQQHGLGDIAQSWVSTGPNKEVSAGDLQRVFGADVLQQLSQKSGLSVQDVAQKLAQVLPQAVDTMTPDGKVPAA
jgi:uncharacterized protein YidB (DUF937 family)